MGDYGKDLEFGISVAPVAEQADEVSRVVRAADRAGLELVGIQDHPYQRRFLDTWTLISTLVPQTERIRFFPNVANLPLRPPAMLAKAAASLDVLSGGRIELGLGAGAFWDAIQAMDGPRRSPGEARRALEEAIQIMRLVWSDERSLRFDGEFYSLRGMRPGPKPAHDIGIWLGVYGPRMLSLLGRLADGWVPSLGYTPPEKLPGLQGRIDEGAGSRPEPEGDTARLQRLREHRTGRGRPPRRPRLEVGRGAVAVRARVRDGHVRLLALRRPRAAGRNLRGRGRPGDTRDRDERAGRVERRGVAGESRPLGDHSGNGGSASRSTKDGDLKADHRRGATRAKKPDVVWLPTPEKVVDAMLHLAGAGPGDVLYDLGSGDGRTAIAAAARFGVREARGVEVRKHLLRRSREQARRAGVRDRVRFLGEDLFRTDLAGATVVTLYLLPRLNRRLRPRLLRELRPGARVVSHDFGMDDWTPDRTLEVRDLFGGREGFRVDHRLHLWVVPADAGGTWRLKGPDGEVLEMELVRRFQKVQGTLLFDGRRVPLRKAKLVGDALSFAVRGVPGFGATARFEGRMGGDVMDGSFDSGGGWTAERVARRAEG